MAYKVISELGGGPVKFSKFVTDNGLTLVIQEVKLNDAVKYVAALDCAMVLFDNMLVPAHGIGDSPDQAEASYRRKIAGYELAINPTSHFRREVQCPSKWLDDVN
jgi:hypothetical protein